MSNNEELIMHLDLSRMQHDLWRDSVNQMYDYSPDADLPSFVKSKEDVDELITLFRDFD